MVEDHGQAEFLIIPMDAAQQYIRHHDAEVRANNPSIMLARRITGILAAAGKRQYGTAAGGGFLVTPGVGCTISWSGTPEARTAALPDMAAVLRRCGLPGVGERDTYLYVAVPDESDEPVLLYEGFVREGVILSVQCAEGRHLECPDQTADDSECRDGHGPLDGYYCECCGCDHGPAGLRPGFPHLDGAAAAANKET